MGGDGSSVFGGRGGRWGGGLGGFGRRVGRFVGVRRRERKRQDEAGARAVERFAANRSAVQRRDLTDDRETEPRSFWTAAVFAPQTEKTFENAFRQLRRDAGAEVADDERNGFVGDFERNVERVFDFMSVSIFFIGGISVLFVVGVRGGRARAVFRRVRQKIERRLFEEPSDPDDLRRVATEQTRRRVAVG